MSRFLILLWVSCSLVFVSAAGAISQSGDGSGVVRTVSDDISLRMGGTIQPRVTFSSDNDQERYGFGLRRMRLRLYTDIGDRLGLFLQMEGSGAAAAWLDVRGEYRLDEHLTLRAGRFVGTQPRAFARTLHSHIDAIDRPAISDMWARMTIGADGRDYGLEALWSSSQWEWRAFLHNGYNQWNYRSGISNVPSTGGLETGGMAFSASGTYWPSSRKELETGAFFGVNTSKNPLTQIGGTGRNYLTYSAQAYWGPLPGDQPLRVKADLIGISYQEVEPFGAEDFIGTSLFGAMLIAPHVEVFAMGEYWYGDGGAGDSFSQVFATLGGSYSLSALQGRPFVLNRILVAYSLRTRPDSSIDFSDPAHVLMLQTQFYF